MASFEHTVSRNLQCPICFDLLSDPKQLSCTHTFCKKCLSDILASQNQANTVRCPICRSTTDVKDGNVENLNTNVPLKSLVDDVRNCKQLCEMCDKKSRAVRFCCDCGMHFCNVCLERHNNWPPHLNHKVVSVEDIREGKVVIEKKVFCQEHVHKTDGLEDICTDVCTTCKKLICTRCRMIYHTKEKGHIVQDAGIYEASIKEEIESLQVRGRTKATTVKNHMTCVDDQLKRVTDHSNREKARISREYEEAIERLKERKATINQRIEAQKRWSCQSLKKMKVEDKSLADSIECASELVGRNLNAPLAGDIVAIRDSLSRILKNILDRDDPRKKLAIDVADRAEQLKFTLSHKYELLRIGRMTFRFGFRSAFFLVLALVLFEFMLSPAQLQIGLRCEVEFPRKDSMNYMTATPDGRMAVGYHNGGIDVFSPDGQLQQTVLKDVRILGVGFLSNDRYVVNTWNKITLYTSTWEKLSVSFESLSIRESGIGSLTVDSGLIYVSYWKAQKIRVFSPDGMAIREIPCDGYEPMQIASFGNALIVKQDSNAVIIIDNNGNIKHELTKSSDHCLYAAVSNSNSVLIATISDEEGLLSIDEYTTELKHMKTLISDFKIEKPEKRKWYYLQQFRSGEIAFCTPDRLYIFHKQILPNGKTNEGDAIKSDSSDGEESEEEPVMSDEKYDEAGDEEESEEEPVMSDEEYDEEDDEEEFEY